ncbi:Cys-tRNA(Pro) deacylase [Ammoniphilus sp. YIM 78166]|uniref:Cys-tRNA(Pro) deacylase n=1 Tax=Ammoniphilus sp. YIM 78166 TaxID=1644106 RepID=UPI00106FA5B2|nr:Cys-tRNA(Pro) deacylase [Ammoniphilus sp. YIM 78166]
MSKIAKTNAMRILDQKKVVYQVLTYDSEDGRIDGLAVAEKVGKDPDQVYKTLVAHGIGANIYVFVIPVADELDLKKAAKACGEKKLEMLPVKDILKWTGYIRGGCSPVGMKKLYPTFVDRKAEALNVIIVSGGKIGVQVELSVQDLCRITDARVGDVVKE